MKLCVAVDTSGSALGMSLRLCHNCGPALSTLHSTRATQPPSPVACARFLWTSSSSMRTTVSSPRRLPPPTVHGAWRLLQFICWPSPSTCSVSQRVILRLCYSSREHEWRRPQQKSVVPFRFEIDVGVQLDPMSSNTINALLREHAIAGVALQRLLSEQHIDEDAVIKRFRDFYDERALRRACKIMEFRLDLRRAAHSSPSSVAAAFCSLIRISDAEIDTLARRLELAGLSYPSGLGLVPISLIEFVDHRFLS